MHAKQWRESILAVLSLLVAGWLIYLIWGLIEKAQIAVTQANDTKLQYETLEKRKATLQASVEALQTDRGRETAIRTAFGVARPGEEVIVVVPPATTAPTSTPSWWQKIVSWF